MATRTTAEIKKPHYRVLFRTPAAFSAPGDAAAFATFLATFTEAGYAEDKTIKMNITKGDEIVLDNGNKLLQGYNGTVEALLLQTEATNYAELEAIENIEQDWLLYAEDAGRVIFFGNAIAAIEEDLTSGETEKMPLKIEKENFANKAAFRTRFAEPTT